MTRGVAHTERECTVAGCATRPRAHGYCDKHYRRWVRHGDPLIVKSVRGMPDRERFWVHVTRGERDECWPWTSEKVRGYGRFKLSSGARVMAHRFAYEQKVGPIPVGLTIDHLCRTLACCNPTHLEPVTIQENIRRRDERRGAPC